MNANQIQDLSDTELRELRTVVNDEHERRQRLRMVTDEEQAEWCRGGDGKIRAIKMLRERLGLGLHDAKLLLERHAGVSQ